MAALRDAKRLVVKIGSALLVDAKTGKLRRDWLVSLAEDVAAIRKRGTDVILVSSGSIALGRGVLGLPVAALPLEQSQAAAAVGQIIKGTGSGNSALFLNPNVWKNKTTYKKWASEMPGGFFEETKARGVITHEMGHALTNIQGDLPKITKIYSGWTDTEALSKYASKNAQEMAAEAFVVWESGGADRLISGGLGDLVELFKGWASK